MKIAGTLILVLAWRQSSVLAVLAVSDSPAYLASYPDFTPNTCFCEGSSGCILYTTAMFNIRKEL